MSMEEEIVVSTYATGCDGKRSARYGERQITQEQLAVYAEQLKDYLLKVECTKSRSYDNSDDDRVVSSDYSWGTVKYCEIDPLKNSKHLIVEGDTVVGVMFFVRDNRQDIEKYAFTFDGRVQETIRMGYSASHSSEWTYLEKVSLVKRGEDGAPNEGYSIDFSQSKMYPSI